MKKQVRYGVFETNSSSTHSVVIRKPEESTHNLVPDSCEDCIMMRFGDFGWEERQYTDAYTKLQYALTMVIETEGNGIGSLEEFYELSGFQAINDLIKHRTGYEVKMDEVIKSHERTTYENVTYTFTDHEGYIDHQSCEEYACLQEFLDEYGLSLEEFIFDSNVVLCTDNDNH